MFGLAEIQKNGCPMRPVESMINTLEEKFEQFFNNIIKTYISNRNKL